MLAGTMIAKVGAETLENFEIYVKPKEKDS